MEDVIGQLPIIPMESKGNEKETIYRVHGMLRPYMTKLLVSLSSSCTVLTLYVKKGICSGNYERKDMKQRKIKLEKKGPVKIGWTRDESKAVVGDQRISNTASGHILWSQSPSTAVIGLETKEFYSGDFIFFIKLNTASC